MSNTTDTTTNQDNINRLINKQFVYYTKKNRNARMFLLRVVDRTTSKYAVCKVVDKSHDSETGDEQVFKTLHYERIEK